MTSKQVMLTTLALLAGCVDQPGIKPLASPYPGRQVWAVAPLRNESGSLQGFSYHPGRRPASPGEGCRFFVQLLPGRLKPVCKRGTPSWPTFTTGRITLVRYVGAIGIVPELARVEDYFMKQ